LARHLVQSCEWCARGTDWPIQRKDIVQVGTHADGTPFRWPFTGITPDSFRWTGEVLEPDGKTWLMKASFARGG